MITLIFFWLTDTVAVSTSSGCISVALLTLQAYKVLTMVNKQESCNYEGFVIENDFSSHGLS